MSDKSIVITEKEGKYHIENNGISEFALLGILECIVFDIKNSRGQYQANKQSELIQKPKEAAHQSKKEIAQEPNAADLRTRIGNAIKAIKSLGGEITETDISNATDEELQAELKELTDQYKRLKNSKGSNK